MFTTFLALVCILMGITGVAVGTWFAWMLFQQESRMPLRYYAMAYGLALCGVALVGIGQGLRVLLAINAG